MTPTHAVIIPHYNDTVRLRRCLTALMQGERQGVEILVVDNTSTEPLDFLKADFPEVRLVVEPKKGAALARNRGVRETSAEQLFFLDADCVPSPDWLTVAKRVAANADIIGGAIDVFDETPPPRTGAQAFETVFAFNYKNYFEKKHFSVTANLLTSRSVFDRTGPFVNGISEDEEWCLRARAKGFGLVLEERLRVVHPTRSDWASLKRKWYRMSTEMFALHRARRGSSGLDPAWALRALVVVASLVAHLPKLILSPKLGGAGERFRGALTLIRLRLLRFFWMMRQALGLSI